jgi:hypothetical protein
LALIRGGFGSEKLLCLLDRLTRGKIMVMDLVEVSALHDHVDLTRMSVSHALLADLGLFAAANAEVSAGGGARRALVGAEASDEVSQEH